MKKSLLFIAIISCCIMVSCTEENTGPNCGTATFSWKEDGTVFQGNSVMQYTTSYENYALTACISGPNAPNVNIRLHAPISIGTYSLAHILQAIGPNTGDASYFDTGGGSYFTTDSTHLGTLTISSIATDSAITGTFSMSVFRYSTNTTHTITEGQFMAIK